jgi:hypothetical protein
MQGRLDVREMRHARKVKCEGDEAAKYLLF